MVALAFSLQPDREFLGRVEPLLDLVDLFEATPETLWFTDATGRSRPNGYFERYRELGRRFGKRFIAHGVAISPCTLDPADAARKAALLANVARVHEELRFEWYTDHFGACVLGGDDLSLPLPVVADDCVAAAARASLDAMRGVLPDVGFENSVFYFHLGDPLDDAAFLGRCVGSDHLLLDLHNVFTMATNAAFDAREWIARTPLDRVIEIHVSGGKDSDPAWLKSGASLRLDGHDSAVPEEVFALLEWTLPRCPRLRAVTLERMEGSVEPDDVAPLANELARLRRMIG